MKLLAMVLIALGSAVVAVSAVMTAEASIPRATATVAFLASPRDSTPVGFVDVPGDYWIRVSTKIPRSYGRRWELYVDAKFTDPRDGPGTYRLSTILSRGYSVDLRGTRTFTQKVGEPGDTYDVFGCHTGVVIIRTYIRYNAAISGPPPAFQVPRVLQLTPPKRLIVRRAEGPVLGNCT